MKITLNTIENVFKSEKMTVETAELKGFKLIKNLFCDNSGLGASDEPAYTINQLKDKLTEILNKHNTVYTYITDAGQFQVYIGVFIKDKQPIATNIFGVHTTYRELNGSVIIRYHDTDIFTKKGDIITLNTGGYKTKTTKERMNQSLANYFIPARVFQKDFEFYLKYKNKTIKFENDSLTIKL
jgi:hypothetical protein